LYVRNRVERLAWILFKSIRNLHEMNYHYFVSFIFFFFKDSIRTNFEAYTRPRIQIISSLSWKQIFCKIFRTSPTPLPPN
jgi:hypothetical protein